MSFIDFNEIEPYILLALSGLLIRQTLIFANQAWAKSYAQTISFMLLPIITFVITKTISGNIALSLGMIGALSIVRFRHPVKSALELIIYFDLITLGIATSVRTKWAIQLVLCTILILIIVKIINIFFNKKNKNFYNISFNEGAQHHSLEVNSSKDIDFFENNINLKNATNDLENNEFIYHFIFENKNELFKFKEKIKNLEHIKKIETQIL
tara:strand:- start:3901 stop:4533 length:633 start_codon:yes stop_codon:yes gene_type:complete